MPNINTRATATSTPSRRNNTRASELFHTGYERDRVGQRPDPPRGPGPRPLPERGRRSQVRLPRGDEPRSNWQPPRRWTAVGSRTRGFCWSSTGCAPAHQIPHIRSTLDEDPVHGHAADRALRILPVSGLGAVKRLPSSRPWAGPTGARQRDLPLNVVGRAGAIHGHRATLSWHHRAAPGGDGGGDRGSTAPCAAAAALGGGGLAGTGNPDRSTSVN